MKKLIASNFSSLLIDVTMYCAKYRTLSRFLGDTFTPQQEVAAMAGATALLSVVKSGVASRFGDGSASAID